MVETPDGRRLICHPRGKKSEAVVGDHVTWHLTQAQADEGVIVQVEASSGCQCYHAVQSTVAFVPQGAE